MFCTVFGGGGAELYRTIARGWRGFPSDLGVRQAGTFWPFAVLRGSFSLLLCHPHTRDGEECLVWGVAVPLGSLLCLWFLHSESCLAGFGNFPSLCLF